MCVIELLSNSWLFRICSLPRMCVINPLSSNRRPRWLSYSSFLGGTPQYCQASSGPNILNSRISDSPIIWVLWRDCEKAPSGLVSGRRTMYFSFDETHNKPQLEWSLTGPKHYVDYFCVHVYRLVSFCWYWTAYLLSVKRAFAAVNDLGGLNVVGKNSETEILKIALFQLFRSVLVTPPFYVSSAVWRR
jgi:hypothetical protein